MKKLSLAAFLAASAVASAASIDHIMNYTPEYNGNPALMAAINKSSTVNYNPAGLVRLEDGVYINGGLQFATGEYSSEFKGNKYSTDLSSTVPNFSMVKKTGKMAFFWTAGGIAGGAGVDYADGISKFASLEDQLGSVGLPPLVPALPGIKLSGIAKGENRYLQTTLGGSYILDSKWSTSAALRIVRGQRNFKGTLKVENVGEFLGGIATTDVEREAWGFGGQFGVNYAATERLNIALRYDTQVNLKFDTKGENYTDIIGIPGSGNGALGFPSFYPEYADGYSGRRDLPAILALGASYKVNDQWMAYLSGNYYFNKDANIDKKAETATGAKRTYDNGYEIAVGTEYAINQKWTWMAGMNYAVTGAKSENFHDSEFALNSFMLGTGAKYNYNENWDFVGTVAHYFYDSDKSPDGRVTYKKETTALGLGFTYTWN